MRLLLAKDTRYDADIRCKMVIEAKRVMTEQHVSRLLLSIDCAGRESGLDIIDWACDRQRLPAAITLIDRSPIICRLVGEKLQQQGYRAIDMRNYVAV